jgi:hypothetical protein
VRNLDKEPQNLVANYIFLPKGFQAPNKRRIDMDFEEESVDFCETTFSDP